MNDDSMTQTMDRVDEVAPRYFDGLPGERGSCGGGGGPAHAQKSYSAPQQSAGSCGTGCGCHGPSVATEVDFETRARKAINKLRPFLQMDGGDMEIIAIEDNNVLIRLQGACQSCPSSTMHMKYGIETALKKEIPEFGELITIE